MTTAVPLPVQIGLVGAPGSGKSKVAAEFAAISAEWFQEHGEHLWTITNPGEQIKQRFDQAVGVFGSWEDDVRAYHVRFEDEELARRAGVSFVSVGTAVENIAHCGVNLENMMVGLATPDTQQRVQQQQVAMTMLTFLFLNNFRYLFGFYVPHPGAAVILPGQDDSENTYNLRIDAAIRHIFGNFGLRIQVLDQPSVEEKAQAMFDTVRDIVENGVPERTEEDEEVPPAADDTLTA